MFNSILTTTTGALSVSSALICMGLAVVLGIVISVVHTITSRSNKNFAITLAVLPAIVQVVIRQIKQKEILPIIQQIHQQVVHQAI